MNDIRQLSDQELLARTLAARRLAHDAPMAAVSEINKFGKPTGKRFVSNHTDAWAATSREWMRLADEVDRRGLQQPVPNWDGNSRR